MDAALVLVRLVHFASALMLWGAAALHVGGLTGWGRVLRRVAVVNLFAALAWFGVVAGQAAGGWSQTVNPGVWTALAAGTWFGQVWLWHLAAAGALLLATSGRAVTLWAAVHLGTMGVIGHAVLPQGGLGVLHQVVTVLHLLAAGFWLGGLVVILPALARPLTEDVARGLRWFSRWGHLAVAVVLASGLAKTALILSARPEGVAAGYGLLLAVKVVAVLVMVGLALRNRYVWVPHLAGPLGAVALAGLRRNTLAELALAALVLALVSLLATLSPFATV